MADYNPWRPKGRHPPETPCPRAARRGVGNVTRTRIERKGTARLRQMAVFSGGPLGSCPRTFRKTGRWCDIAVPFRAEFLAQRDSAQTPTHQVLQTPFRPSTSHHHFTYPLLQLTMLKGHDLGIKASLIHHPQPCSPVKQTAYVLLGVILGPTIGVTQNDIEERLVGRVPRIIRPLQIASTTCRVSF